MTTVVTPLALRWLRAQQIDRSRIQGMGPGWFYVPSSRGPDGYAVHVEFDADGKLTNASCTCPDFAQRTEGAGTPMLYNLRVCKHVLAATLKAREAGPQAPVPEPVDIGQAGPPAKRVELHLVKPIPLSGLPLPEASEPIWDPETQEWTLYDSEGRSFCSDSPSQCRGMFDEARRVRAEHAAKDRLTVAALSHVEDSGAAGAQPTPGEPGSQPSDDSRRQALSRARGIANQARPPLSPVYRLYGLAAGDVVDCSDRGFFLAVEQVEQDGLAGRAVSQTDPWGAPPRGPHGRCHSPAAPAAGLDDQSQRTAPLILHPTTPLDSGAEHCPAAPGTVSQRGVNETPHGKRPCA